MCIYIYLCMCACSSRCNSPTHDHQQLLSSWQARDVSMASLKKVISSSYTEQCVTSSQAAACRDRQSPVTAIEARDRCYKIYACFNIYCCHNNNDNYRT